MKNRLLIISALMIILFSSCEKESQKKNDENPADSLVNITILYTSDEHGWFQNTDYTDGAAGLTAIWKETDGYDGSDNYLILSGGDMWTGAAASTWFQGESMVEVMNEMEYDAAAIGNHEFDFQVTGLNQRLSEMTFPLLSANIRTKADGQVPDFATPYIVKDIHGVKVGLIGLSSITTPYSTFPAYVEDYNFIAYEEALNEYLPLLNEENPDVIILVTHLCESELMQLLTLAQSYGISVMTGGHCHQVIAKKENDVILIAGGDNMEGYAKVRFNYNVTQDLAQDFVYNYSVNNQGSFDTDVKTIVDYWMGETTSALSEVVGYASEDIPKYSDEMWNLVCDSWLYTFPNADVSLTNAGGIRQDIPSGDITLETIVGLLPFENTIYQLELTGSELKECMSGLIMGGMTAVDGYYLADGTPIEDQQTFTVLTTDYLYSQTSINFSVYDPNPYNTGVHYRQPLIDWLKSINTSSSDPINNYLDYDSRW